MSILVYLEKKKELLDDEYLARYPNATWKIRGYLEAIDTGETEKYWDKRDCYKKRMSWKDFNKKWGNKKMKKNMETIVVTEDKMYVCSSEQDRNVICPICLSTNTALDRKCRNCGMKLNPHPEKNKLSKTYDSG